MWGLRVCISRYGGPLFKLIYVVRIMVAGEMVQCGGCVEL